MPFPLLVALAAAQEPVLAELDLTAPFVVAEPVRLAMTPKLDGTLSAEEWDPLSASPGANSYLQWEPRRLHLAAVVPAGSDVLLSLDLKSNGWLVGDDNIEVRISPSDAQSSADGKSIKVTGRRLDATRVEGPTWVDLPGIAMSAKGAARSDGINHTYEVTIEDPSLGIFPTDDRDGMAVRVDALPFGTPPLAPYLPRVATPLSLRYRRAAAIPEGMRWGIEGAGNAVMPGNTIRIRYTFNGSDKLGLKRLSLRSEGPLRETTTEKSLPFPLFDNKGRAFVDYETEIRPDAEPGWRVSQGALEAGDGLTGVIQACYRVAPLVDIVLPPTTLKSKDRDQRVKLTFAIESNAPRRLAGIVRVTPPAGFRLRSEAEGKFLIYGGRGSVRRGIELDVPANARGVYPIEIRTEVDGILTDETIYLNLD
jgi:hypothetical protein